MAARVKICGVMRPEDAQLAIDAGASAIGVVLWPGSRRAVTVERAKEILARVPDDVVKVGVFVDQSTAFVENAVRSARLDAVQLHGRENPAAYDLGCPVLKSVAVGTLFDPAKLDAVPPRVLPLLDTVDDEHRGGTGRTIDWHVAASAAATRRVVLAGGLTPANVGQAIRLVRPFAVDVSSGVEIAPGRKSAELIRGFVDAVRAEAGDIQRGFWW